MNEWDVKSLIDYATVIIYAKRRSGKSHAVQRIIYENKDKYDSVYLFSNTIELQPKDVFAFVPEENKYNDLRPDVIQNIMNEQQRMIMEGKKPEHVCLVMDDIISSGTFRKRSNNIVSTLFTNGRHYHITLFILTQSFSGNEGVPPVYRKNADYIMSFYLHNINDLKGMSEQYLSIDNTKDGMQLHREITTSPFQLCVVEVFKQNPRKYEDYVYKYTAPEQNVPKFQIPKKKPKKNKEIKFRPIVENNAVVKPSLFNFNINIDTDSELII